MSFSPAQFEATLRDIESGMATFSANLGKIPAAAQKATDQWFITDAAAEAITWLATRTVEIGQDILNWFIDLLKGAVAPIYMAMDSWQWMNIRGEVNEISANLTHQNLSIDESDWSGKARDAYGTAVGAQSAAAARVGAIATSTSINLLACAVAGAAFYVVLAGVLVKLIAATVTIIAAYASAAFSWAGAALMLEEAGVNTAVIMTALGTLTTFLGAQTTAMIMLHGDAVDPASFPNGVWPMANSSQYSDATVKDGDADWSLMKKD
ncbi:hypothetical protein [Couchioplanes caeruleus]|uniref:PPE family protein n=2 Tax=Couchioplanes caeruleus TaxID=56438 RepID=A0A1K0GG00_9ACTN|nr:hypothetical protein [Couchioplanes caeruleus]OJF11094.1 hypothetical protein BG844_28550 [Couchioplanes caeruleus subsp. caeruleus]ROP33723.1 hypothetical protein EDD30_6759 [Couchioplanes caeruleus]